MRKIHRLGRLRVQLSLLEGALAFLPVWAVDGNLGVLGVCLAPSPYMSQHQPSHVIAALIAGGTHQLRPTIASGTVNYSS